MVKILAIFIITFSLNANDFTTIYRTQGIDAVQKALDASLMDRDYWLGVLAKEDTRFGFFEKRDAFLTCNKGAASLHYFVRNQQNRFEEADVFDALTGKMNGDKQVEGDHKTPVGIYRLIKKLDKLDPFYGPLAYVTSYPNLYDKIRGKNGSGIWIHGVPNDETRETYTKGCIALNNSDIKCLDNKLDLDETLLIISEKEIGKTDNNDLASLLANLYAWRHAWLTNDLETYLSFYRHDFTRFDGMKIKRFRSYKKRVFSKNEQKQIRFSDLIVLPYPGKQTNLYMIRFYEEYKTKSYTFNGEKVLIVSLNNETMRIVSER